LTSKLDVKHDEKIDAAKLAKGKECPWWGRNGAKHSPPKEQVVKDTEKIKAVDLVSIQDILANADLPGRITKRQKEVMEARKAKAQIDASNHQQSYPRARPVPRNYPQDRNYPREGFNSRDNCREVDSYRPYNSHPRNYDISQSRRGSRPHGEYSQGHDDRRSNDEYSKQGYGSRRDERSHRSRDGFSQSYDSHRGERGRRPNVGDPQSRYRTRVKTPPSLQRSSRSQLCRQYNSRSWSPANRSGPSKQSRACCQKLEEGNDPDSHLTKAHSPLHTAPRDSNPDKVVLKQIGCDKTKPAHVLESPTTNKRRRSTEPLQKEAEQSDFSKHVETGKVEVEEQAEEQDEEPSPKRRRLNSRKSARSLAKELFGDSSDISDTPSDEDEEVSDSSAPAPRKKATAKYIPAKEQAPRKGLVQYKKAKPDKWDDSDYIVDDMPKRKKGVSNSQKMKSGLIKL
jgi:hypothetical protein